MIGFNFLTNINKITNIELPKLIIDDLEFNKTATTIQNSPYSDVAVNLLLLYSS